MNVSYKKEAALTFIGYHTEPRHEEGYQKCPEFRDRNYAQKQARLRQTTQPETPIEKAICENSIGQSEICGNAEHSFTYRIAGPYRVRALPIRDIFCMGRKQTNRLCAFM